MSQGKRLVLDTNIVISSLFWLGNPRKILEAVRSGVYGALTSDEMEQELIRVLAYPKFGLTPREIVPLIQDYRRLTTRVVVTHEVSVIQEDPTDDIFLACAVSGGADFLVSGDRHLLNIESYEEIPILSASQFVDWENL